MPVATHLLPVARGARIGFLEAGITFIVHQLGQLLFSLRLAFFVDFARGRAADRHAVLRVAAL